MNTGCCCSYKDLRWFNNGKTIINVSSDFINYQRYASVSCLNRKESRCFGDYPNQKNSSSYTNALKSKIIYKFAPCSKYSVEKPCNPFQIKPLNTSWCKCVCTPR